MNNENVLTGKSTLNRANVKLSSAFHEQLVDSKCKSVLSSFLSLCKARVNGKGLKAGGTGGKMSPQ